MTPFITAETADQTNSVYQPPTADELKAISDAKYGYTSGKIEPVVHVIEPEKDWVVRNSYGALIWVSTRIPILDIDIEEDKDDSYCQIDAFSTWSWERKQKAFEAVAYLNELGWSFRLYHTCSGLRIILTDYRATEKTFAENSSFWSVLSGLPIDPNYKALCIKQKCFRARLSTKPWRSDDSISVVNTRSNTGMFSYFRQSFNGEVGITRISPVGSDETSDDSAISFHDTLTGAMNRETEVLK